MSPISPMDAVYRLVVFATLLVGLEAASGRDSTMIFASLSGAILFVIARHAWLRR